MRLDPSLSEYKSIQQKSIYIKYERKILEKRTVKITKNTEINMGFYKVFSNGMENSRVD